MNNSMRTHTSSQSSHHACANRVANRRQVHISHDPVSVSLSGSLQDAARDCFHTLAAWKRYTLPVQYEGLKRRVVLHGRISFRDNLRSVFSSNTGRSRSINLFPGMPEYGSIINPFFLSQIASPGIRSPETPTPEIPRFDICNISRGQYTKQGPGEQSFSRKNTHCLRG